MGGGELGANQAEVCRRMGDPILSYRLLCTQWPSVAYSSSIYPMAADRGSPPAGVQGSLPPPPPLGSLAAIHRLGLGLSLLSLWNWHQGPTVLVVDESAGSTRQRDELRLCEYTTRVHHRRRRRRRRIPGRSWWTRRPLEVCGQRFQEGLDRLCLPPDKSKLGKCRRRWSRCCPWCSSAAAASAATSSATSCPAVPSTPTK